MKGTRRISVEEIIASAVDPGSFRSWDTSPTWSRWAPAYRDELEAAALHSGVDESVVTGEGLIDGCRVALIASEFSFLGGTLGVDSAERIVRAFERATDERLPVIASPCSGGTRMQEGTPAFVAMVSVAAAVARHTAAGLPYAVYLRHPCMGGALASFGSLGHITLAQPGARIGFLGPRVFELLFGDPFPAAVQTAENLVRCGVIDGVSEPDRLRGTLVQLLALLAPQPSVQRFGGPAEFVSPTHESADPDGWAAVSVSRRRDRPSLRRLLRIAAPDAIFLNGTGHGERRSALVTCLARFHGEPCVVVGQDRVAQRRGASMGPDEFRTARRAVRTANALHIPVVTVIDTAGADVSAAAEEGGLAGEIARCLSDLIMSDSPIVSVLMGEGAGGGALALLPADRVIAAQNAWLSPLPPEGASAIIHRDVAHAPDQARAQGITSFHLARSGVVDRIVAERPDAANEPDAFCRRLGYAIAQEVAGARGADFERLGGVRYARYRALTLPVGTEPT